MFWAIIALLAVICVKYYTAVGSQQLHRRINRVKLDLENSRRRLRDVRATEYEAASEEELTIERVRYMKEIIADLRLRLTLRDQTVGEKLSV